MLALVLAGCTLHEVRTSPPPPVSAPTTFSAADPDVAAPPDPWWEGLGDDALPGLIEVALTRNFTIASAWARLRQAAATAAQAGAARWPSLEGAGTAGVQRQSFALEDRQLVFVTETYSVSAAAQYEVDLWDRLGSDARAAVLQARAARSDLEAAAVTVSAEVAEAWFDLRLHRALVELLERQAARGEVQLEVVLLRFRAGIGRALDVAQQRSQLSSTRAQIAQERGRHEAAAHRLLVLLGAAPGGEAVLPAGADALPVPPPLPALGVPADLLARRPDVRAAMLRVEAADHQVAAAIAARLPALRLSGEAGFRATRLADLFSVPIWSLFANATAPIFDGGRLAARADEAHALLDEAVAEYGRTFLAAVAEVEDALSLERHEAEYLARLEDAVEASRTALAEALGQYQRGLDTFLPVLTALQTLHAREQEVLRGRRQRLSYRIQLHRALGGSWTQRLVRPGAESGPALAAPAAAEPDAGREGS